MRRARFSKAETRILEQCWKLGVCSVREILDSLPENERVAYTTVQTLVYRLEQKGALRRVKKIGNAQLFEPAIDQRQYRSGLIGDLLDLFGGSPRLLVSNLLEMGALTLKDLKALQSAVPNDKAAVVAEGKNRMIEHIARTAYYFEVHLLYASLVWFAALGLTTSIRGSATTKYWIWVATSLNFVIPLGAILDKALASHIPGARPLTLVGTFGLAVAENAAAFGAVWLVGALLMLTRLCLRLRTERGELRRQSMNDRAFIADGVPVEFAGNQGPAVNGVLRSRISLPEGIDRLLTKPELNAVLLHEVTHAKRRDNLICLIHEAGLCLLWFHPLMWITGSRLALYRELSCDERVIQSAHGPDLISALTKLTDLETTLLLQASASSFMSRRLARLAAPRPSGTVIITNALLVALFGVTAAAGVCGTVAHTACCFILKK